MDRGPVGGVYVSTVGYLRSGSEISSPRQAHPGRRQDIRYAGNPGRGQG
jgi:hypothetical protein